jgi:hypothetical protein
MPREPTPKTPELHHPQVLLKLLEEEKERLSENAQGAVSSHVLNRSKVRLIADLT